jgi:hypothetical protein
VDSIAEKLVNKRVRGVPGMHVPFIVLGSPKRLGPVAMQFTLNEQIARHRDVKVLHRATRTLERMRTRIASCIEALMIPPCASPLRREHLVQSLSKRLGKKKIEAHVRKVRKHDRWRSLWRLMLESDKTKLVDDSTPRLCYRYAGLKRAQQDVEHMLKAKREALENKCVEVKEQCLDGARVMLCTIATACGRLAARGAFEKFVKQLTMVIIDEAGTCPERKMTVPLTFPRLKRVVAIGDQKQLQPFSNLNTTRQDVPQGLLGFFHRLEKELGSAAIHTLSQQYRMHPRVCTYISRQFYHNSLVTPQSVAEERRAACAQGLYFMNVPFHEQGQAQEMKGFYNSMEAKLALATYLWLVPEAQREVCSVLVISFYRKQLAEIRKLFFAQGLQEGSRPGRGLRITSVDKSQGAEADLVIISCTRSNHENNIGFLKNPNRLNVAVSRTRCRTVVLGNQDTLSGGCTSGMWRNLIAQSCCIDMIADMEPLAWHPAAE